jgi:hypothetical protein
MNVGDREEEITSVQLQGFAAQVVSLDIYFNTKGGVMFIMWMDGAWRMLMKISGQGNSS